MTKTDKRAFCIECREETGYILREEMKSRFVDEREYRYRTVAAYCEECGARVSVPGLSDKDLELFDACYRQTEDIITIREIEQLMERYGLGKAPLSLALGFGEVTVTRYLDGQMPSRRYSERMRRALNHPEYMLTLLAENRERLGETAYKKAERAAKELARQQKASPRMQEVTAYILKAAEEITPLALQKLLYFSQGISLGCHGRALFEEDCEAWVHGPVYPGVYEQYKKYGYDPIEDESAYMASPECTLSQQEREILDLVVRTFGMFSGKILETITHREAPWVDARDGVETIEYSRNVISKAAIREYYSDVKARYGMGTDGQVMGYIQDMLTAGTSGQ